jgi:YVTN family beta-propeller protein
MRTHMTSHLAAVTAGAAILSLGLVGAAAPATAGAASPGCRAPAVTVYVVNDSAGTVTPIRAATNTAGPAIKVGGHPLNIAITPNGKTAYVTANTTVTPVTTTTGAVGKAITVGEMTQIIVITPNGKTVYAVSLASGTVTPISTRTNKAGPPIKIGAGDLVITPNSKTAYAVAGPGVIPFRTATNKLGTPIKVAGGGGEIAITPNGKTVYVLNDMAGLVTPIRTATNRPGRQIRLPVNPSSSPWYTPGQVLILSTPDSKTVYAANATTNSVTPISTATNRAGKSIKVGMEPYSMAITPNGRTLVVVSQNNTVTLINTATNKVTATINVVTSPVWYTFQPVAVTPDSRTAYVVNYESNAVTPISLRTGKAAKPIAVGEGPVAIAISPAPQAHR